jgi:hypothetical protein
MLDAPQNRSRRNGEQKSLLILLSMETRFFGPPARIVVVSNEALPASLQKQNINKLAHIIL